MNFERTQVLNFPNAFYGMRNPKKSWNLSDSYESNVMELTQIFV